MHNFFSGVASSVHACLFDFLIPVFQFTLNLAHASRVHVYVCSLTEVLPRRMQAHIGSLFWASKLDSSSKSSKSQKNGPAFNQLFSTGNQLLFTNPESTPESILTWFPQMNRKGIRYGHNIGCNLQRTATADGAKEKKLVAALLARLAPGSMRCSSIAK